MGGGGGGWNPVAQIVQAASDVRREVSSTWDKGTTAIRTGVNQEADRLGVNRAFNDVNRAWDDTTTGVRTYGQQQANKFYKYGKGLMSDPKRLAVGALTVGLAGGTEVWREAGAEAKTALAANLKGGQEPAAPPVESAAEVKPPAPDNADIKEAQRKERLRSKKGRASTILHGGAGITDQAQTARNTLLGA